MTVRINRPTRSPNIQSPLVAPEDVRRVRPKKAPTQSLVYLSTPWAERLKSEFENALPFQSVTHHSIDNPPLASR
jgi:hypothetical protein